MITDGYGTICYKRAGRDFIVGLCLALLLCVVGGCHSAKNTTAQTLGRDSSVSATAASAVSASVETASVERDSDTAHMASAEAGRVDIRRDSVGRLVSLLYYRTLSTSFDRAGLAESLSKAGSHGSSTSSSAAGSTDSVSQTTQEITRETGAGLSVGRLILLAVVWPIALYLIYLFYRNVLLPWLRTKLDR
jgi:predicted transcriptional regulator